MSNSWTATHYRFRTAAVFAILTLVTAGSGITRAGDIKVSGEVEAYVESGRTNFDGDYNTNTRGDKFWDGAFSPGLPEEYSYSETRFKEAELKFKKDTEINDSWTMTNEIELEFKAINAGRKANDYDLEEASAIFKHTSGLFIALGILEDKKLYEGGLVMESASNDAKGFDENPGIRVGYDTGDLTVDLRYSSIFVEAHTQEFDDADGDGEAEQVDKVINETHLRLQAEYKAKDLLDGLFTYTQVDRQNKEESSYQNTKALLPAADFATYDAAELNTYTVMGLGVVVKALGNIQPTLTYESWAVEEDDGADEFDVTVITAGLRLNELGPGNLVLEVEQGELSPKSGSSVTSQAIAAEYLWTLGKSKWGPGFKTFSNDAEGDSLKGTAYYFGGEWIF